MDFDYALAIPSPEAFVDRIDKAWNCKNGPPRPYFEWKSVTLPDGCEIGRTMYVAFYIGAIEVGSIFNGRVVPATQTLAGAVEWFEQQVGLLAHKEKAKAQTHDLYWRARPEIAFDGIMILYRFYARLGFAPKDAMIIDTED
jgi:hypothetical protein